MSDQTADPGSSVNTKQDGCPPKPTPTHHIQTEENPTRSKQLERRGKYTIPKRRKDKNYMCSE